MWKNGLSKIIDLPVSAGQVRRRAQRRDAEVRAFHSAPLSDEDEDLRRKGEEHVHDIGIKLYRVVDVDANTGAFVLERSQRQPSVITRGGRWWPSTILRRTSCG